MPNDVQVSALVEIARSGGAPLLNEAQQNEIDGLVSASLIVRTGPDEYDLTPAGQKALDDRGVGANEA
jgi:hypothetical protein